jgi:hypothetical protein
MGDTGLSDVRGEWLYETARMGWSAVAVEAVDEPRTRESLKN